MINTINMQDMRHLNLFSKITGITTRHSLRYNNMIIFCVPRNLVLKAVGEDAKNLRQISGILNKKIRVIASPRSAQDIRYFVEGITRPITFKNIEIKEDEVVLTANGTQNKAALIGRDKKRLFEMQKIIKDFFGKSFRIA